MKGPYDVDSVRVTNAKCSTEHWSTGQYDGGHSPCSQVYVRINYIATFKLCMCPGCS